ncbi:hypothetical protein [Paucibacter sp. KBW04]|uniref:hypothetical protein n=1 Tax=Paucibacter sp. KBW04 TaxID=2153361 RepID=UPI001E2C4CE9|nr:hypothetical protein [Paucibacter sp. KBW04]
MGNRDRLVPLPESTLAVLRRFWSLHRHPKLMFPNRLAGRAGAYRASSTLNRGGVQRTLSKVVAEIGLRKRSRRTAYATAMPRTCLKPALISCRCRKFWVTTAS